MDGLGHEDLRRTGPASVPDDVTPELLLCTALQRSVGADGCAASVSGPSERFELASTDSTLQETAHRQFTLWEGPGPDALSGDTPVVVPDLHAEEQRWPRLAPLMRDLPVRTLATMPLRVHGQTIGLMSAYWRQPAAASDGALATMTAFAEAMAAVLARRFDAGADTLHLPAAEVSPAVGTIVARLDVSPERALAILRAKAQTEGRTAQEIAARLGNGSLVVDDSWSALDG